MRASFRFVLAVGTIALLLGSAVPVVASQATTTYALSGDAVFPEGIAFDQRTGDFYVTSTQDGSIQRGNVNTSAATPFIAGSGAQFASIGLELDAGRLAVAGGTTGEVRVYDASDGSPIRTFTTGTGGFLNDAAATANGDLFVTDSTRPILWRVPAEEIVPGAPLAAEAWLDLTTTPIVYQAGFNLNGIVATPDDRYLIVSQTNTGELFRIDLATKAVIQIDLGGESVAGDGLALRGQTLFAVADGLIVKVRLSDKFTSGDVLSRTGDASFSSPTTLATARGRLLVVNSQFANQGGTPTLPFTVSSVPIP